MKKFLLEISEDLHLRIKIHCAESGITMQEFLNRIVTEYLDKHVK